MLISDVSATYNPAECDDRPGAYYVSVVDGPRFALLAGPYETHREALSRVSEVRKTSEEYDDRAVFYAFGTCRLPVGTTRPGLFNRQGLIDAPSTL